MVVGGGECWGWNPSILWVYCAGYTASRREDPKDPVPLELVSTLAEHAYHLRMLNNMNTWAPTSRDSDSVGLGVLGV